MEGARSRVVGSCMGIYHFNKSHQISVYPAFLLLTLKIPMSIKRGRKSAERGRSVSLARDIYLGRGEERNEVTPLIVPFIIRSQLLFMSLSKVQDSPQRQNDFFQKFEGKVNKVPRLGIKAVLLKEEFEEYVLSKVFQSRSKIIKSSQKEQPDEFSRTRAPALFSTPQKKQKIEANNLPSDESKILRRDPSEKLPLIYRSSELTRQPSVSQLVRQKVKSEEAGQSNSGSKYRSWKYPPRLSEQALRFFAFADGDSLPHQRSARN